MASRLPSKKHKHLVDRFAAHPLSTEDLYSTWKPPEWEDIIAWWDEMVTEAWMLSPYRYRNEPGSAKSILSGRDSTEARPALAASYVGRARALCARLLA